MNFESSRLIELEKQDSFKKSLFIRQKHLVETSAPIQPDFNFVKDEFSAKKTFTGGQKMFFFCAIASSLALLFVYPFGFTLFFSAFFSIFYFLVCVFRLWALKDFEKYRPNVNLSKLEMPKPNSRYSVLVAIYDEANQVSDLVASLSKLKWPIDALEIFIICEERDEATINAVRAIELPRQIKLVICPPGQPQTKPRALNYAMQAATGEFLVIYDAEDRPHPNQLIEAYNCFKNSEEKIACVQAPLIVDNTDQSFLSKMFAIEYRTLFLGTVRSLAHWKSPMPLGGTSNHFNGIR